MRCPHNSKVGDCPLVNTSGMDKAVECNVCGYNIVNIASLLPGENDGWDHMPKEYHHTDKGIGYAEGWREAVREMKNIKAA